jgi:hypothetical protein
VSFWDFNTRTSESEEPNLHGALSLFTYGDVDYLREGWRSTMSAGQFDPARGIFLKNLLNAETSIQDISTEFTMEVMVKTPADGSPAWQAVAGRWSDRIVGGHRGKQFLLNYYPNERRFVGFIGDGAYGHKAVWNIDQEGPPTCYLGSRRALIYPNRWYHVILKFDGSGQSDEEKLQLWIDGDGSDLCIQRDTGVSASIHQPPHWVPFSVGAHFNDAGDPAYHFAGKVDYVRVYNEALSEEEIQWLFLNRTQEYYGSYFKFIDGVDP